ncbi:hypothetical protein [Kurthia massiliensis]|uniref:hypothetical protein n=1 Tax=Kurthia massiliensis TaxID=1033739 RepID=UPI000287BCC8|nr:hypothetical protein [Kurthia massiliensis]
MKGCLRLFGYLLIVVVLIGACSMIFGDDEENSSDKEEKTEKTVQKEEKPKEEKPKEVQVKQDEFEAYAQNITGGPFIKNISVKDNKGHVDYFGNYEEYKKANPDSQVTEESYKQYFDSGDAIEKILVSENVRLLREFPDLKSTSMSLPYEGKEYSINLNRQHANEYLGFKIEDLNTEDGSWEEKFVSAIVYNDVERQKFFNEFVTVK